MVSPLDDSFLFPDSHSQIWDEKIVVVGSDDDDATEDNNVMDNDSIEDRCKVKVWRCLSKVMEDGVTHIEKTGGLWR